MEKFRYGKREETIKLYDENPLKMYLPKDETIFKAVESEIKRYSSFSIKDRLFGKSLLVKPSYLANLIKFISKVNILINEGEIVEENVSKYNILRSFSLVGEGYKGGYGYDYTTAMPFGDSFDAVRRAVWFSLSGAIQDAYEKYSSKFGEIRKARREYDILSKEKKVIDIENDQSVEEELEKMDINLLVDRVIKVSKRMSRYSHIHDTPCSINLTRIVTYFINSEGTKIKMNDFYFYIKIGGLTFDSYGELEIFKAISRKRFDINFDQLEKCGEEVVNALKELINCERIEPGIYPVWMDGPMHAVIWHEGIGHLLERDPSSETFLGKIGKKIAPHFINVECDPTLKDGYGSYKYDDEGVPGQKVKLVENGILKGFLHSRLTAGKIGRSSNGHARAGIDENEVAQCPPPSPRMSNLVIKPTVRFSQRELHRKFMELVRKSGKKYGIYCKGYRSGAVEIESGKNEIHPLEVFKVYSSGKMERIKDAYIISTPHLLINKVVACGEMEKGTGGYCSGSSGVIPTDEFAPSAIFEGIEFAREHKRNERRPFLPKPKSKK